jgi:hypothetical protein
MKKRAGYLFGLIHECESRRFSGASCLCHQYHGPAKEAFGATGSEPEVEVSGSMPGSHAVQAVFFAQEGGFALFSIKLTIGKPSTGLIYKPSAF